MSRSESGTARWEWLVVSGAVIVAGVLVVWRQQPPTSPVAFNFLNKDQALSFVVFLPTGQSSSYRSALHEAIQGVRTTAEQLKYAFSTVGVVVEFNVEDGITTTKYYGPFDEIIVGRNWLNTASVLYLLRDHPGVVGIPQVVVIEEPLAIRGRTWSVGKAKILARRIGQSGLEQWARDRYRLEQDSSNTPIAENSR